MAKVTNLAEEASRLRFNRGLMEMYDTVLNTVDKVLEVKPRLIFTITRSLLQERKKLNIKKAGSLIVRFTASDGNTIAKEGVRQSVTVSVREFGGADNEVLDFVEIPYDPLATDPSTQTIVGMAASFKDWEYSEYLDTVFGSLLSSYEVRAFHASNLNIMGYVCDRTTQQVVRFYLRLNVPIAATADKVNIGTVLKGLT